MSEIQTVLEKLRREVAECLVLSNVATDPEKQQLFARVADRISGLASAVQSELVREPAKAIYVPDQKPIDVVPILDHEGVDTADSPILPERPTKLLRMRAWLVVAFLIAAAGAFVLARTEKDPSLPALEAKVEPPPAPRQEVKLPAPQQDAKLPAPEKDAKQVIAEFKSAEEDKRKLLTQQLDALAARIDNLEKAHAEDVTPATKRGDAETTVEPTTTRETATLRPRRHRKVSSANSRGRRQGWQLFGGTSQFRF